MSWIIDRLWRIIGLLEHSARKHNVLKAHCASIDVESPMADWIAKLKNHGFLGDTIVRHIPEPLDFAFRSGVQRTPDCSGRYFLSV